MRLLVLAFVAALMLFFGCVSTVEPAACGGLGGEARDACIYKEAVLSQEPYGCYFIGDMLQRGACLRDSTDVKAKHNYTQKAQPAPAQPQAAPEEKPPLPPAVNETPEAERLCAGYSGDAADSCYRDLAFQEKSIAYCKKVRGTDMRSSCISTVAFVVKNPAICAGMENERDRSLCNFYSKGSAESG